MARYVPYSHSSDDDVVEFHVVALVEVLGFIRGLGVETPEHLSRLRGRGLLSESLWKIGEANLLPARKHNLRYFSEGAHAIAVKDNRVPTSKKRDGVEHEHIIPRKLLEASLLRGTFKEEFVRGIALLARGCIVTVEEHRRLEKDPWSGDDPAADPWRRYREAREGPVKVWDRHAGGWVDLTGWFPSWSCSPEVRLVALP